MVAQEHKTLGRNVRPSIYELVIEPNLKTFKFNGSELIKVKIDRPVNEIRMNADELKISSASVTSKSKTLKARTIFDKKNQTVSLRFGSKISGDAEIQLKFSGINNDKLYGFYRSRYVNGNKAGYILTSQLEPADARHAFPCFDEPEMKARFNLSFIIDKDLDAVSNMPIRSTRPHGRKKIVAFQTTPIMSTYLLYLCVGKLESVKSTIGKLKIRLITVPGKIKYAKMAMGFAKKFIPYFERYFGIKYPLPKIDFIGIPDFAAGAMENWGAITFREVDLLGDEKNTSVATKQRIASVIAHELAHQWFGDLVTMRWWNDMWLNESFATLMAYKAVDSAYPLWETDLQYGLDTLGTALAADQLNSTHPISMHVNDPAEISQLFDEIGYDKGGSFLNMLEDYVGKETFRHGLHAYLSGHSYGNATTDDLWNAISAAAKKMRNGINVRAVSNYWINNPGYPLVEVSYSEKGSSAKLEQRRYLLLDRKSYNQVWPIPLHYSLNGKESFLLFNSKASSIELNGADRIKLNVNEKGVYRVKYPDDLLARLGEMIKSKKLGAMDAWGVENDLFSFARSLKAPLQDYLDFVERYCFDSNYPLNSSVSGHLNGLTSRLYGRKSYEKVRKLSIAYHSRILQKLGWERKENELNSTTFLRAQSIGSLGTNGDRNVIEAAKKMFEDKVKRGKEIDPNLRGTIYRINAWNGATNLDTLKKMYNEAQMPEDKLRLLGSTGSFQDPKVLNTALNFSMSKEVRLQDSYIIPGNVAGNPVSRELIWKWTRDNWKELMKRNGTQGHLIKSYVGNLGIADDAKTLAEIRDFYSKKENMRKDIENELAQTLEIIEVNIKFIDKYAERI